MPKQIPKVFLDANIVINAGKPPGDLAFERVVDLANAGIVTVLTTDLTLKEVAKKHALNDFELLNDICKPHFREILKEVTKIELPLMKRAELRKKLNEKYQKSTEKMFKAFKPKALAVDDVKPSIVLAAYSAGQGFFSGEGKKDQFPDAFIFECLKKEASKKEPVIIVSNDGDFKAPVKEEENIILVTSLSELFTHLQLELDAPEVEGFLNDHNDEIVTLVSDELSDWGLHSDDGLDAEIDEINVDAVVFKKLAAFKPTKKDDPILVVGVIGVEATVSYTHPDWDGAMYDSEDKVLIPFDHVDGETDVEISIDISMSIILSEDGEPEEIDEFRFRNPGFQYVTLYRPDRDK